MNNFIAGFISGFTVGFLLMVIISIILGILAVLSLTMQASDLPSISLGQHPLKARLSLVLKPVRAIKSCFK
jgi:hypothetical protein